MAQKVRALFPGLCLAQRPGFEAQSDHLVFVSTVRLVLYQFLDTDEGGIIILKSSTRILKIKSFIMFHRESFQFNFYKYYRTLGSETPIES